VLASPERTERGLIGLDASANRARPPVASDVRDLGRFTSPEAEREYVAAYDKTLEMWPLPFANLTASTPFADTHVIASGPETGQPLILRLFAKTVGVGPS